jgi:hypothetical protein
MVVEGARISSIGGEIRSSGIATDGDFWMKRRMIMKLIKTIRIMNKDFDFINPYYSKNPRGYGRGF